MQWTPPVAASLCSIEACSNQVCVASFDFFSAILRLLTLVFNISTCKTYLSSSIFQLVYLICSYLLERFRLISICNILTGKVDFLKEFFSHNKHVLLCIWLHSKISRKNFFDDDVQCTFHRLDHLALTW